MKLYEEVLSKMGQNAPPPRFAAFEAALSITTLKMPLHIVETGVTSDYANGLSTLYWASLADVLGRLHSIDLDDAGFKRLAELGMPTSKVTLHKAHSLVALSSLPNKSIDLAYLDSDADPDLMLHEFLTLLPKLKEGAVVLADDADTKGGPLRKFVGGEPIPFRWASYGKWTAQVKVSGCEVLRPPGTFGMLLFRVDSISDFRCVRP